MYPMSTLDLTIGSMPYWFGIPLVAILWLAVILYARRQYVVSKRARLAAEKARRDYAKYDAKILKKIFQEPLPYDTMPLQYLKKDTK